MSAALIARYSKWRLVLLLLLSIGFVVAGVWMTGLLGPPPREGREWLGWVAALFFGVCCVGWTKRLTDVGDVLRITEEGVFSKPWSDATIPWTEIDDISVWQHRRVKMIILHLRNPERWPSRRMAAKLAGVNRTLTGGDIAIALTGTDVSFDDAMAAIQHFKLEPR